MSTTTAEQKADAALEKEHEENDEIGGFLERPYNRYRFHNGFTKGYTEGRRDMAEEAAKIASEEGGVNLENPFVDPVEYGRRKGIHWASEWIERKIRALAAGGGG